MKISSETLAILKNFANINQSILIRPGNKIRTMSPRRNLFGSYTCKETFEQEFAIYDLMEWISIMSMFEAPEISLETGHMVISQGKRRVKYRYASPSMIAAAPNADPKLTDVTCKFKLSTAVFREISKASSILQAPHLVVSESQLVVRDMSNTAVNEYFISDIVEGSTDTTSLLVMAIEHLNFIPQDYEVHVIASKKMLVFQSANTDLTYCATGLSNY